MRLTSSWKNLTKMKIEKTQVSKIRKKKRKITGTTEIKEIIRDYLKNLCSNTLANREEMDKFLDTYDHSGLNKDDTNHLNRSLTHNEIKAAIEFHKKKSAGPDRFSAEFYQSFKEELIATLLKLFHKIEMEGTLTNSFY
jgi:hypothetical protein